LAAFNHLSKETPLYLMAGPHIRSGLLESTSFQKSAFCIRGILWVSKNAEFYVDLKTSFTFPKNAPTVTKVIPK
jgi:hypothetical protein